MLCGVDCQYVLKYVRDIHPFFKGINSSTMTLKFSWDDYEECCERLWPLVHKATVMQRGMIIVAHCGLI